MAPNIEAKIAELLSKVGSDPEAAAELLGIAADFLDARKAMPDALADHLAKAFKYALLAPKPAKRASNLIHGLCLKREKGGLPPIDIPKRKIVKVASTIGSQKNSISKDAKLLLEAMGNNGEKKARLLYDSSRATLSETELKNQLVKEFNISEGSARKYIKETKKALLEASEILDQIKKSNGLSTLIRKR